ncbi:MAG TPA: hypothetical protein VJY86_03395 [Bacilli bacterium]|nr:hypothetical protein [Bacilli bacterium]
MARRKSFTHLDVDDRTMTQVYLNQGLSLAKLMATICRRFREKRNEI